ncbi:MAG: thylakoid membrane photosystem I accumulation factor [Prochloraceae cyanobacterium]
MFADSRDKINSQLAVFVFRSMISFSSLIKKLFTFSLVLLLSVLFLAIAPARASIDNDRYDGNIYVVYAGNGALVPPKLTLAQSFQRQIPIIIVFYIDDNSDSKQFAPVVSRMQEFYGRAASIIPIAVDSIPVKSEYTREELGYYYDGVVPQTVILNAEGEEIYNGKGQVKYEEVDDVLRKVFDLLPRSESVELKRRSYNEFSSELAE